MMMMMITVGDLSRLAYFFFHPASLLLLLLDRVLYTELKSYSQPMEDVNGLLSSRREPQSVTTRDSTCLKQ